MVFWKKKQLILESALGGILKKERIARCISIDDIEKRTNIQKRYIVFLEKSDYSSLPGKVYVKNFIKNYADFLNLNTRYILEIFEKEYLFFEKTKDDKNGIFKNVKISNFRFIVAPKIFRNITIAAVFFLCFCYLSGEAKNISKPPALNIYSPLNNLVTSEQSIKIIGETDRGSQIFINDKLIIADSEGKFSENINLQIGVNIIKIVVKKKYTRENVVYRKVLVIDESAD
ncbi:helix-turn-helix domain-containing protein [Candidatus Parcubacteria bacterium]|nr:helix-turn-helix domain-containing protein [Candidatus Parcubacteria bacterium]